MQAEDLEQYLQNRRFKDGLTRCSKLLKKSPNDATLLIFKARFLRSMGRDAEAQEVIKSILGRKPPVTDLATVQNIEDYLAAPLLNIYPSPLTIGNEANLLWSNAAAGTPRQYAVTLQQARFKQAVRTNRWIDAGYALANWRKAEPNNKTLKLLHAAIYQLIADKSKDGQTVAMNKLLAARTLDQNLGLILKSQDYNLFFEILMRQSEHEKILQFLVPLLHLSGTYEMYGLVRDAAIASKNPQTIFKTLLPFFVEEWVGLSADAKALAPRVHNDWRSWEAFMSACNDVNDLNHLDTALNACHAESSRYMLMVKMWLSLKDHNRENRMRSFGEYWTKYACASFCFNDLKRILIHCSKDVQLSWRETLLADTNTIDKSDNLGLWMARETNALKLEYFLHLATTEDVQPEYFSTFVENVLRLHRLCRREKRTEASLGVLLAAALIDWHAVDHDGGHLFEAAYYLEEAADEEHFQAKVLLVYLYSELGLYSQAIHWYQNLNIKEMQHDTFSHSLMTRISISMPGGSDQTYRHGNVEHILEQSINMYGATASRISGFQEKIIDAERPDMLFELDELRNVLGKSLELRVLLLESKRTHRALNLSRIRPAMNPPVLDNWTHDLEDWRDYKATINLDTSDRHVESAFTMSRFAPKAMWIQYNLWIEETWSHLMETEYMCSPFIHTEVHNLDAVQKDPSLTSNERYLVSSWESLGRAALGLKAMIDNTPYPTDLLPLPDLIEGVMKIANMLPCMPAAALGTNLSPFSEKVQLSYLILDHARALNFFLDKASTNKATKAALPKATLDNLRSVVQAQFQSVQSHARGAKAAISSIKLRTKLMEGNMAAEIFESEGWSKDKLEINKLSVKTFVDDVCESAHMTWDGVLKVNLALKT